MKVAKNAQNNQEDLMAQKYHTIAHNDPNLLKQPENGPSWPQNAPKQKENNM